MKRQNDKNDFEIKTTQSKGNDRKKLELHSYVKKCALLLSTTKFDLVFS